MVTESDEGAAGLVLGQDLFKLRQSGGLRTSWRKFGRRGGGEARREGGLDEILQSFKAEKGEHVLLVFFRGPEMAWKER